MINPTKNIIRGNHVLNSPRILYHTSIARFQEAVNEKTTREEHSFQAETRELLNIVARSLYSDKEVFIRELVSNSSDALEKLRYISVQDASVDTQGEPFKISIKTDKFSKCLEIIDNGVGMEKEELIKNLGTIARSGSKEFMEQYQKGVDAQNIIGQFGVGFYSTFMVSDKVEVFTRSHKKESVGYQWASDGSGKYAIEECPNLPIGTRIVCHLKIDDREYSDEETVKSIVKKYSSFVGFPVELNGVQINTVEPIWLKDPKLVSIDDHNQFYKFIGTAFDMPRFILHFQMDVPVNLRCLLYFPESKPGLFDLNKDGSGGVSLYSRRVLIKSNIEMLLPKWLRFVKVIQNRVVRFLVDKARKEPEAYKKFLADYGVYLKEGILSSQEQMEKEEIAKLVMYESSKFGAGETVNLADYVGRMQSDQNEIYYLASPSRELAESSPYLEAVKNRNVEILFCYENYDEIVLMQLRQFNGKNIKSVEKEVRQSQEKVDFKEDGLQQAETNELLDWIKNLLAGKCFNVKATPHLESHPCVITVEDMGAARHFVRTQFSQFPEDARYSILQPQLEINPR
ncbi:Heat shock protein, mitochondrial [Armadillidium nasatum]|uniref:Heat shock protein, mitochondrial n=1 Tax=Armadillidium nasatum TaxID=96803 RepID=A0A5N5SQP7_9CRUS|nr:Heat shock protein, mitochondrial [Armadillidium nasatum]